MTTEQELLKQAAGEIKCLRAQNNIMAARLETFDQCMLLLNTPPAYRTQGMSPDLVSAIEKNLAAAKTEV